MPLSALTSAAHTATHRAVLTVLLAHCRAISTPPQLQTLEGALLDMRGKVFADEHGVPASAEREFLDAVALEFSTIETMADGLEDLHYG